MAAELFTRSEMAGALTLALVAGCVPALQPILLGGLLAEHRLTASQIGQAATLEAIGMALSAAIAGAFFKPARLRWIAFLATSALCVANGATVVGDGLGILAARALNGAASGVLLWILVGMMARIANPGRLFALYVLSQAIVSFLLATLFATIVIPTFGVAGGYWVLVALGVMLMLPIAMLKSAYSPIAAGKGSRRPTVRGSVGLLAVGLDMAGIFAFWVYLVPLGGQLGFERGAIGLAISVAIGLQIIGGLTSFACAGRIDGATATAMSASVSAIVIVALLVHPTISLFYLAIGLTAFLYTFAAPFHIPLLITADPSHRSAMFVSSAQLVGVAVGPMIASLTVYQAGFVHAALVSVLLFAATTLVALVSPPRRNVAITGNALET